MMMRLGAGALLLFCYVDVVAVLAIGDFISDAGPALPRCTAARSLSSRGSSPLRPMTPTGAGRCAPDRSALRRPKEARPPLFGEGGPGVSGTGVYFRPLLIALTSSPLAVSPLNSQKNAPPRPWLLAQAILVPTVAGVS